MKKTALAVSALMSWSGLVSAQSIDNPWYAGVNVAGSRLGVSGKEINGALTNQGITASSTVHSTDKSLGAEAGYRFNANFAAEVAYESLGAFRYDSTTANSTINGKYKADALS